MPSDPDPQPPRLVDLSPDHPGFHDRTYRARRDRIAHRALCHVAGQPLPDVGYTAAEQRVWREVWESLRPLHLQHCDRTLLALQDDCGLHRRPLPQLAEVDAMLRDGPGRFRLQPVAGLVDAEDFLSRLADGIFLCTQYVRHPSRPQYTPEPDLLHELIGHAASLLDPEIAAVSRAFGAAARRARSDPEQLQALERVYWFTLEFGVVADRGEPRAFGAGLLSSVAELRDFASRARLLPLDIEQMSATPYDPTGLQPLLFVAPDRKSLFRALHRWLARPGVVQHV